jgi:TatD DNase family protein
VADRTGDAGLPPRRAARGRGLSRRRAPDRLPGIVDSHAHLQDPVFDADREAVIERATAAGIERILVPGYDLASSEAALQLAARHPGLLQAAVGIHPHHAAAAGEREWAELERLAAEPGAMALGEIGLDFFRNLSPPDVQRSAFDRQLELAARVAKPVVVHDRDAHQAIEERLDAWSGPPRRAVKGVLHCFSGDAPMAQRMSVLGYLVSFALPVSFRSAVGPRAAAAALPAGGFLLETDSPWLAPGVGRNEPTTVLRVAAELARLRDEEIDRLVIGVRASYERLLSA